MFRTPNPTSLASPGPAAGASAAVREYLCLFTHDLRRKQKRWQDGRLKYHTFNKRVMVYDERGNFVGDMHWQAEWEFDVGEEVELERGGVIVQVSDCVGQETQDLSVLLDKRVQEREQRVREKEQRRVATASPGLPMPNYRSDDGPGIGTAARPPQQSPGVAQIRHRALTSLLGTPTGHHGRASVPTESPFAQRRQANSDTTVTGAADPERPSKRRRYEDPPPSKMGYAQSLFGATLSLSGAPSSSIRRSSQPLARQTVDRVPQPPISQVESQDNVVTQYADDSQPVTRHSLSTPLVGPNKPESPRIAMNQTLASRTTSQFAPSTRPSHPDQHIVNSVRSTPLEPQTAPTEALDLTLPNEEKLSKVYMPAQDPRPAEQSLGRLGFAETLRKNTRNSVRKLVATEDRRPELEVLATKEQTCIPEPGKSSHTDSRRTELQLKSRKKRGLLLVSEQANVKPKEKLRRHREPVATAPNVAQDGSETEQLNGGVFSQTNPRLDKGTPSDVLAMTSDIHLNSRQPARSLPGQDSNYQSNNVAKTKRKQLPDNDEDMAGTGPGVRLSEEKDKSQMSSQKTTRDVGGRNEESQSEPRAKRRYSRKAAQAQQPAPFSEDEASGIDEDVRPVQPPPPPPPLPAAAPPRLIKLGRKSVRSKELIGFVLEDTVVPSGEYGGLSANSNLSAQTLVEGTLRASTNQSGASLQSADNRVAVPRDVSETGPDISDETIESSIQTDRLVVDAADSTTTYPAPQPRSSPMHGSGPGNVGDCEEISRAVHDMMTPVSQDVGYRRTCDPPFATVEPTPARTDLVVAKKLPDHDSAPVQQQRHAKSLAAGADSRECAPGPPAVQVGRLANPATRGRKAALKSHAAGQVPQPALPLDMMMPGPQQPHRRANTSIPSGAVEGPPKRKMTFPGFVSAKESGPWSREAHDLLGMSRPTAEQ